MTVTAIVGANWGDEGKGKMTDALAGRRILSSVSKAEATRGIPLSIRMENLRCGFFLPASSIRG